MLGLEPSSTRISSSACLEDSEIAAMQHANSSKPLCAGTTRAIFILSLFTGSTFCTLIESEKLVKRVRVDRDATTVVTVKIRNSFQPD